MKKERLLEAKDEIFRERAKMEKDRDERRNELQRLERRILQKEENFDKKQELFDKRERGLTSKEQELARKKEQLTQLESKQRQELEKVAKMSTDEARELLLSKVEGGNPIRDCLPSEDDGRAGQGECRSESQADYLDSHPEMGGRSGC